MFLASGMEKDPGTFLIKKKKIPSLAGHQMGPDVMTGTSGHFVTA